MILIEKTASNIISLATSLLLDLGCLLLALGGRRFRDTLEECKEVVG